LRANTKLGDFFFYERDLALPFLQGGMRADFDTPPLPATRVALVTNLSWSAGLTDGTVAAKLNLRAEDGRTFSFDLRVGIDTSEWAYDRPETRATIRHSRAPIATSSSAGNFDGRNFIASFALPEKVTIIGGNIETARIENAPNFGIGVQRISFIDETQKRTVPLRSEWIAGHKTEPAAASRWREVKRSGNAVIYQNERALPRTWIATDARVLPDKEKLAVIRSDPNWDPAQTVLLGGAPQPALAPGEHEANIVRYEPNEVDIKARTTSPAILVLAENHYPGWRVRVDENRAPLLRVDYNLRGVQLAPGEHNVRFSYRPKSIVLGGLISLLTATGLLIFIGKSKGAEPRSSNQHTC
jgi:hypothetical protein